MGNTCCLSLNTLCWTDVKQLCPLITKDQLKHPIQCVEDSLLDQDVIVLFDSESFPIKHFTGQTKVSVQCVEDPDGEDGEIVIDCQSFHLASRPTAF